MSRWLTCQLFVPRERLGVERVGRVLSEFALSGFRFERGTDKLGAYAVDADWHEADIEHALRMFEQASEWGVELRKDTMSDGTAEIILSISRGGPGDGKAFHAVNLITDLPFRGLKPGVAQEFLAWSIFLAELTHPTYGWGGSSLGLFDREVAPVPQESVAVLAPQSIEWLNIFGIPYVRRIGVERLRSVPAADVHFLSDGSIAVILGADPDSVTHRAAKRAATHLGMPPPAL